MATQTGAALTIVKPLTRSQFILIVIQNRKDPCPSCLCISRVM